MIKKITFLLVIITTCFLFLTLNVSAHPGSKNDYGCHVCNTNCDKWGYEYDEEHCHIDTVPRLPFPKNDYSYEKENNSYEPNRLEFINNIEEDFFTKYRTQIESLLISLSYIFVAGFSYYLGSRNVKK